MIIRILWVQAETDLELQTYMKVMLGVILTTPTILPVSLDTTVTNTVTYLKDFTHMSRNS